MESGSNLSKRKNVRIISYFFIGIGVLSAACDSGTTTDIHHRDIHSAFSPQTLRVKVVSTLCGTAVLQIQDEGYYAYGVKWESAAGITYEHVFGTTLPCFTDASAGDFLLIQIVDKPDVNDCARCEAYLETPDKRYDIKVLSN